MHIFIPIDSGRISTKTRSILSCEWVNPNPFIHHVRNFVWKWGCSWIQWFIVIPSKIGNFKQIWQICPCRHGSCIQMDCEEHHGTSWNIPIWNRDDCFLSRHDDPTLRSSGGMKAFIPQIWAKIWIITPMRRSLPWGNPSSWAVNVNQWTFQWTKWIHNNSWMSGLIIEGTWRIILEGVRSLVIDSCHW